MNDFLKLKQQCIENYFVHQKERKFFREYTKFLDCYLKNSWKHNVHYQKDFCLIAIGGFGRAEVYPYSDIDFAIVLKENPNDEEYIEISKWIQSLWDKSIMPAARTGTVEQLAESVQNDLDGSTAFLETRYICGNKNLGKQLLKIIENKRNIEQFIEWKILEQKQRYEKAQGASNQLEPDIKNCPGGLRDIHTLLWIAKVQGLKTPEAKQLMTKQEAQYLISGFNTLSKIRMHLHYCAHRAEERLLFDFQNSVATSMGLVNQPHALKNEQLMKMLYRSTKTIKQLGNLLLPVLQQRAHNHYVPKIYPINEHFEQWDNLISAKDIQIFEKDDTKIFQILSYLQKNKDLIGFEPKTLRSWWQAGQNISENFYKNPKNRQQFVDFFRQPYGLIHILRILNLYGILGKYIPAFDKIVGLLQHDLFHIYPVDDHILMVVRNLRRLDMEEHHHELTFASSLMHSFKQKDVLYLSALFHDIAKGRGGDHAYLGVYDAQQFAHDHFLDQNQTDLLCWLVQYHLLLSRTAQKEDIQDIQTIENFCKIVNTPEKLTALYLLTVADVRGTNPAIWNQWKAGLFENLFHSAMSFLQGENIQHNNVKQYSAKQTAQSLGLSDHQQKQLWNSLGENYFIHHDESEIIWHINEITTNFNQSHTAIQINDSHLLQVMVYMPNRPMLFAGLCAIFGMLKLNIVNARAYVSAHDFVLDTFYLMTPEQFNEEDIVRIKTKLLKQINQFIKNDHFPKLPSMTTSRRSRHLPIVPKIEIFTEENSKQCFTLHIVAADRPGLLAHIAAILSNHQISIRHARINTLDQRVEDYFLIYAPQLIDVHQQIMLKKALSECITQ